MRPLTDGFEQTLADLGRALDTTLRNQTDAVGRREEWTTALDQPLPQQGIGAADTLQELAQFVVPNGTRLTAPGFWGWITSGPTTVPVVAQTAASVVAPQRSTITAANLLEELSLRWLADLCGLAPHMQGVYSSGGSTANLVALGAARQWAWEQEGIDVAARGVTARPGIVYATSETHHTIQRAAGVLGIGRSRVHLIESDNAQRMNPTRLREALLADVAAGLLPLAIVATAGTTNTGSIDPLREIGEIAAENEVWFHVDGAYGLPGSLDDRVTSLYDGLELADSAIVDPHKWLNAPVGVAATFVRDREVLRRAFTQEPASYLMDIQTDNDNTVLSSLDSMGFDYSDFGVELSSPSRGVIVWSMLRELGREGITERIRTDRDYAARVAASVREHPRLELLTEPVLSVVCFRYTAEGADLDAVNTAIVRELHRETPFIPSTTRVNGAVCIRPCFINARTTPELVDGLTEAVVRIGDRLTN